MNRFQLAFCFLYLAFGFDGAVVPADEFAGLLQQVESIGNLTERPSIHPAEGFEADQGLRAIFYDSLPYQGKPTRVFAWVGMPSAQQTKHRTGKIPGIVLVHGGGGSAFKDWVRKWNEQGFAAISIAVEGQTDRRDPGKKKWTRHQWAGPSRTGIYGDSDQPLADQWMYHAVADTVLANSLLRSIPQVDPDNVGIMGISWGGVITSTVIGIDDRFAFAIPTYGCGSLATAANQYGRALGNNPMYRKVWDPMIRLARAKLPTLWLSWAGDQHFPLDALQRSSDATTGAHMTTLLPNMRHGHAPGWEPKESYAFAESVIDSGKPWCQQTAAKLDGTNANVSFASTKTLDSATLTSTTDRGITGNRTWSSSAATLQTASDGNVIVTATLPPETTAWFINVRSGDLTASSDFQKVDSAVSSSVAPTSMAPADNAMHRYPEFSWDHIPLYMHIRKATSFDADEVAFLAKFPLITFEKATGHLDHDSVEMGTLAAARAVKRINPKTKILYYRNVIVHYSDYRANKSLAAIADPFLVDASGNDKLIRKRVPAYDLASKQVRDWWINSFRRLVAAPVIDGVMLDGNVKVLEEGYLKQSIGVAKKQQTIDAYDDLMKQTRDAIGPNKLMLANILRARFPNGGLEYLHYFDGSYLEGFFHNVGNTSYEDYIAKGISTMQAAAQEGKIIAFTSNLAMAENESKMGIDEAHAKVASDEDAAKQLTYPLAIFLICAEKNSYFRVHEGYSADNGDHWMRWFPEYDKPLGPPQGKAVQNGTIYTREFKHANVWLDISKREGKIQWN